MSNTSTNTAAAAMATVDKDCLIANNTSVDVVVLDAHSNDDDSTAQTLYEMPLTVLSAKDGQKVLKAGTSGTFTLDDYHKDANGNMAYNRVYMLIIAKADNLYPVKPVGVVLGLGTQGFHSITVTEDDYRNMQTAENFQQTITAYPSSDLARNFQAVMNDGGDDIMQALANFFQSTNQYKAVTWNMVETISTYYSQYPYVLTSYKGSGTCYLHYVHDNQMGSIVGAVQINIPTTVPANPDKPLPGFTFIFTDVAHNSKPLYYANNRLADNLTAAVPAISLTGLFAPKSAYTKVPSDTAIIPCLTGTVNGVNVIGYFAT